MYSSNLTKGTNWQGTYTGNGMYRYGAAPVKQGNWNNGASMTGNALGNAIDAAVFRGIPVTQMANGLTDSFLGEIDKTKYSNDFSGATDQFTDSLFPLRIAKSTLGIGSQSRPSIPTYQGYQPGVYQPNNYPSYSQGGLVRRTNV